MPREVAMEEGEIKGIAYTGILDGSGPTIVFVHGAGVSGAFWQKQVEGLSGSFSVVALDLPGNGKSKGAGITDIEGYAESVLEFIQGAGIEDPVLCGHSMGGAICMRLLHDHPEIFRAGILVCTGARLKVMPAIFDMIRNDYAGYIRMYPSFAASEKTDPALLAPLLEDAASCRPEVILGNFSACSTFDMMEELSEITAEVLVVTTSDDRMTPEKYGVYLENNIPGAKRFHIKDAGHMVTFEKPSELNSAIGDFLSGLA